MGLLRVDGKDEVSQNGANAPAWYSTRIFIFPSAKLRVRSMHKARLSRAASSAREGRAAIEIP